MADLPPVRIQLVAEGIDSIKNAFQSIEQSAKKLEEALNRTRKTGASKRKDETKREEQETTRIKDTEAKKREANQEREFSKLARQAEKWRQQEIAAEKRKNAQLEAEARKSASHRERFFKGVSTGASSNLRGFASKAIGLAGGIAALGGGFGVVDAVGQSLANQKTSRQIALQTFNRKSGQYDLSPEEVYSKGKALSVSTGFDTEKSIGAIKGFGETAGYENVKKMEGAIKEIGNVAMATGADFEMLSKSAGLIYAGDTSQSADDLLKKLRLIAEMGRNGAVDIDKMSESLNVMTATANQISGDKMKNLAEVAALVQLARTKGTASSPAEALEAAKHVPSDILKNQKHFRALGIETKDAKTGELLPVRRIILDAIAKTGGDGTKLQHLFGERGFKAIQGVQRIFQEERGKGLKAGLTDKEASQKGLDKANAALDDFTETVVDSARMNKEADEMRKDPAIRLAQVFDQLKNEVGDKLVPELIKLIPKIQEAMPAISKLIDGFLEIAKYAMDNPIKTVIAALALAIGASAVSAAIGAAFAALLAPELLAPLIVAGLVATLVAVEEYRRGGDKKKGSMDAESDFEKRERLEKTRDEYKRKRDEGIANGKDPGDILTKGSEEQFQAFDKEMKAKRDQYIENRKKLQKELQGAITDTDNVTGHRSAAEIQAEIDKQQAWLDRYQDLLDNKEMAQQINNERLERNTEALENLQKVMRVPAPPKTEVKKPNTDGHPHGSDSHAK